MFSGRMLKKAGAVSRAVEAPNPAPARDSSPKENQTKAPEGASWNLGNVSTFSPGQSALGPKPLGGCRGCGKRR